MPNELRDSAEMLAERAAKLLARLNDADLKIATAESCTGGLVASLLTDIEGLSSTFERGFVTYTEDAKCEMLGVDRSLIDKHSAVSEPVARAMAEGALRASGACLAVSVTGFAGRAGPDDEPGRVHFALAAAGVATRHEEHHFGDIGRGPVRLECLRVSLRMLERAVTSR